LPDVQSRRWKKSSPRRLNSISLLLLVLDPNVRLRSKVPRLTIRAVQRDEIG
jgi:hypothetical protein